MSAEISPLMVRSPAAARPLWLRLRRSQPFTLTVIMCCLALLWVSPFIWMLATSFSATTFGEDMASLLPRLPLTLDNFRDAWDSAVLRGKSFDITGKRLDQAGTRGITGIA